MTSGPHVHPELFTVGLAATPNKVALIHEDARRTFAEVEHRVGRLAGVLASHGIGTGDRVALLAFNELEFFELQGACQRIGAIFVPINFRLAPPEIAEVIADADPAIVVHGEGFAESLPPGDSRAIWHLGTRGRGSSYEEQLRVATSISPLDRGLDPDLVAHFLYTSGTTGRAKGAMVTNAALATRTAAISAGLQATADDVFYQAGPLFHLTCTLSFGTLAAGGTHVSTRGFDPGGYFDLAARHGVSKGFLAPAMIQAIVAAVDGEPANSLRLVMYGASPITGKLLTDARRAFGCDFAQMYGMTETGAATILGTEEHRDAESPVRLSAGRAAPGYEVEVRDADGASPAAGELGEIVIRSAGLMSAYWRADAATQETVRDGWMHTGDAGHIDSNGYVFVTDRIKDIVITGGENVSCREVEEALAANDAVADVAVVGVPDEKWGQRVHAIVVLAQGEDLDEPALDAWCRERLAGFKRPRSYETVAQLPRNAMGKVLKRVLRDERSAGIR